MFFRGSRYEPIKDAEKETANGRVIRYKRMRFIPGDQGRLSYVVKDGERTDTVAYNTVGDPEQFWRLCDVNRTQRPVDLSDPPGAPISVPGPGGV